ncbi:MAG: FAD-dependent oxidoreductase, partial [Dehalococcoidales bacterium]|nr:FAD-dependent oxidoreductase [Dehalococcoidales bacterium]
RLLEPHLEREGLDLRLSTKLVRLEGDGEGRVARVVTDQDEFETNAVILATGVRANVGLAREAGLALGPTGAIAVNEYLQTSDPAIYAGGDCVEDTHLVTGRKVCCPLGTTANKHGRVIGTNIVGGHEKFAGVLGTTAVQVMDFNIGCTGLNETNARRQGYSVVTSCVPTVDCAHFFPMHAPITLKLVADAETRRLLGAQVVGPGEAVKRVDVAAMAIGLQATVDQLAESDLGYAPPFSTAIDPLAHAANVCRNKLDGLADGCSVAQLKGWLESGKEVTLVDVRTPSEMKQLRQPFGPRVLSIPLAELRQRAGEIPTDRPVVVYCQLGTRSYDAQRVLAGAGFSAVRFLEGGLAAWTGR